MVRLKEERYGEYGVIEVKCKDCKLSLVKFKIELLTDIHIFQMFEKGIQVRITQAFKPCAKSSNKYMVDVDVIIPKETD